MAVKKTGLGKGLEALFIDNDTDSSSIHTLKLSEIEPNKNQPRKYFDPQALRELADSIGLHGLVQPIVVKPLQNGRYQIIAGERRWRASRMAGLSEVPVVIKDLNENQTLEISIIENLQREDLSPIELAMGYKALMDNYSFTQEKVAEKVGKSRSDVANTIRLLNLPEKVQNLIAGGKISKGHAKALLALDDEDMILEFAQKASNNDILVRDIEKIAKEKKNPKKENIEKERTYPDIWGGKFYSEMEIALSEALGRKVIIKKIGKKSTIELEFYSDEELSDIAQRLTKSSW